MSSPSNFPVAHFEPRVGRSVSLGQAAEMLQVSIRTVYYWIREGRLRTIRTLNGSQRVLVDSLSEARLHSHSSSSLPSSSSSFDFRRTV
ncbi:MAG: MerR family DNA-binding transcriptional regulator [Bacteroidales bacterium]